MVALAVRTGRLLIAATVVALAVTAAAGTVDPTSAGPGLVVNSVLHPGAGGCNAAECTLHEALIDANANAGQDAISFDPLVFPPGTPATILMSAPELSASNDPEGVIIDGTGAGVIIDGGDLVGTEAGLVFHSAAGGIDLTGVVVRSLTVQNFPGYGIRVCGGPIIECDEDLSGTELRNVNVLGNGDEGIQIDGANISNTTLADCNSSNNARAGVRVDALLQLTFTSVSACTANDNERQGIWLDGNGVSNATINDSTVTGNGNSGVWIDTDNATDITNVSLDGVTAQGNDRGVQISTTGTVTGVSLSSVTSSSNERRGIEIKGFDLTDIDISDTTTNNNIAGEGIAFYVSGVLSGATISNCVSNGNTTLGINLDSIGAITDLTVTGCSLSDNGDQGARVRSVSDVTDVTFESVTAAGNGGAGILIATAGDNTGTSVTGSTVSDNAGGIPPGHCRPDGGRHREEQYSHGQHTRHTPGGHRRHHQCERRIQHFDEQRDRHRGRRTRRGALQPHRRQHRWSGADRRRDAGRREQLVGLQHRPEHGGLRQHDRRRRRRPVAPPRPDG